MGKYILFNIFKCKRVFVVLGLTWVGCVYLFLVVVLLVKKRKGIVDCSEFSLGKSQSYFIETSGVPKTHVAAT